MIDYYKKDFSELIDLDLDLVFDTIDGEIQANSWTTLKEGGRLVSVSKNPDESIAAEHEVSALFFLYSPMENS